MKLLQSKVQTPDQSQSTKLLDTAKGSERIAKGNLINAFLRAIPFDFHKIYGINEESLSKTVKASLKSIRPLDSPNLKHLQ